MKIKKWIVVLLSIIAIFLEALPYGAVLNFAPGPGERVRATFSYFSMTPYGYANFGPLITAVLTCVIFILSAITLFKDSEKIKRAMFIISILAVLASVMPLMFGLSSYSVVGACITAVLVAECLLVRR